MTNDEEAGGWEGKGIGGGGKGAADAGSIANLKGNYWSL
jgi:hypothetical protein